MECSLNRPDEPTLRALRMIASVRNDGANPIRTYARMLLAVHDGKGLRRTTLIGLAVGLLAGTSITGCVSVSYYQSEAIKRGAAEYDSRTGFWKWKNKPEDQ